MIRSMTGFGKAECLLPDKKVTIEIRSLNSKQMDTSTRLPPIFKEKDLEIRKLVASVLERGKVECILYYEISEDTPSGIINETVVKSYYDQLRRISGELGLKPSSELLNAVMRFPDAVRNEKTELEEEEWKEVKRGMEHALQQVNGFRHQEGEAMEKDMRMRVEAIKGKLGEVAPFEEDRTVRIRERISQNLAENLNGVPLDNNRFEQELIYYLEKLDFSEEKVRLANHCEYFLKTMESGEPTGKKLGFIAQEMGREINTLGSKANHSEIQQLVVEMKDELEHIKEQVLNVL